jgi:hypothetical protein
VNCISGLSFDNCSRLARIIAPINATKSKTEINSKGNKKSLKICRPIIETLFVIAIKGGANHSVE